MKTMTCEDIVSIAVENYVNRFTYYDEDYLDIVLYDVYQNSSDNFSISDKIKIWKDVTVLLKDKL